MMYEVFTVQKGYMNFLEEKTQGWIKRWVVIRRPYILLYRDDKDLVGFSWQAASIRDIMAGN